MSLTFFMRLHKRPPFTCLLLCAVMLLCQPGTAAEPANQRTRPITLAQSIALALQQNHDVRLALAASRAAQANLDTANTAPNPTLTVQSAGINPQLGIGPGSLRDKTVDTSIRIDQLIERGGKRALRTENASHLQRAADIDIQDARRQLAISVSQAYYDLLAAQARLGILEDNQNLFDKSLAAARLRKRAGDLAGADLDRLLADALRAANDRRQAQADAMRASLALARLLGMPAGDGMLQATDEWPAPIEPQMPAQLEASLAARPDVRAAQARVDAAEAARKLALASRTRDVTVGVQYDHYPSSNANTQGGGNSWAVGVQIPLFVRNHFEGEIRAADAALESARLTHEKILAAARNEALGAWQDVGAAGDKIRRIDADLLAAARRASDAAEFAFKNGAIPVMDLLDAQRTYRSIQLDAINARADHAKALAAWNALISPEDKP
ncbi:TolC family protein [Noviherbaspirillum galbum]|uniref:TolC family protein n=1 Tax=Noviherbaspirillum galbum TaxID=2709383 RepID=A0A6B3SVS0_9BURK|nr:TolC family protein [Noviherbaspirillum galbum]NEX64601.1 TolC family protein [Noviherbaspirillum galbum]